MSSVPFYLHLPRHIAPIQLFSVFSQGTLGSLKVTAGCTNLLPLQPSSVVWSFATWLLLYSQIRMILVLKQKYCSLPGLLWFVLPRWIESLLLPTAQCYMDSPFLLCFSELGNPCMELRTFAFRAGSGSTAIISFQLPSCASVQVDSPSPHFLMSFLCISCSQYYISASLYLVFHDGCPCSSATNLFGVGSKWSEVPPTLQP